MTASTLSGIKKLLRLFFPICILFFGPAAALAGIARDREPDSVRFRYPLKITPEISGSFAELRSTHFHGGMDFRTRQKEGLKVFSAAPGIIFRASVSNTSYGKALYVRHADSSVSLYAHLSKFLRPVEKRIRQQQRKSGEYETELYGLDIATKPGRPIARSGNTGASAGPHLHFEIMRDSFRYNPACLGLSVPDSLAPNLLYFALYSRVVPADSTMPKPFAPHPDSAMPQNRMDAPRTDFLMQKTLQAEYDSVTRLRQQLSDTFPSRKPPFLDARIIADTLHWKAFYYAARNLPDTLFLHSASAFGLCALDTIQHMPFHYGLYNLLFMTEENGTGLRDTLAFYRLDRLSFETCKAVNRHIDRDFLKATGKRLEKSWLEPGQIHTPYRLMSNRGVFFPKPGRRYTLTVVAEDISGNRSEISLPLVGK